MRGNELGYTSPSTGQIVLLFGARLFTQTLRALIQCINEQVFHTEVYTVDLSGLVRNCLEHNIRNEWLTGLHFIR